MHLKSLVTVIALLVLIPWSFAQEFPQQDLDSITLTSERIDLPFRENSRTINIITAADIKKSAAVNIADVLQQVAGIDMRRRGTGGTQADLHIRGGNYNQTLLLIDGIKMDDAQTGHHTMNAALPIEVIERIEIVKGPAARVFGQNAFTGAINIVTKKSFENTLSANLEAGSFGQLNGNITAGVQQENASHILHAGRVTSEGYRPNSDYDNANYFLKSIFNKNRQPVELIASLLERNFGAQNFYTPTQFGLTEYEETQNSLIGLTTTFRKNNLKIRPRIYWRRNQDRYQLVRDNPRARNFTVNNKIGAELNASYSSSLGITGFGIDLAKVDMRSNSLGNRNRFMTTVFLEHRFKLLNNKLDITPGIAANYFSDFKFNAFPGVDVGYEISNRFKVYGNAGYTYRVPTYTELFIIVPGREGNENLRPEEAISAEIGMKYANRNFSTSMALFYRDTNNLIDYAKNTETAPLVATNLSEDIRSQGIELDANYYFKLNNSTHQLGVNYTFIDDEVEDLNLDFLLYSVNSLKHQFTSNFRSQLTKALNVNVIYKYAERTSGLSYNVWDASIIYGMKALELTITASNIFDADFIEQDPIPMPPSNVLFGLRYDFQ
ncbi:TonB-dependent receptor [Winogradskyella sp. DF17]|uniref:TonB-dependent receptor n=1 Tax=Winogradskyella pelagia TaxID=2819984 RepID=A0ABS3T5H4_9FLAO|nr:TonB-dependent receptor [Winogradskyella sp. DF17]MBO3118007.1 TonB-dependent receptor [Winogradskyella sp. DF17]